MRLRSAGILVLAALISIQTTAPLASAGWFCWRDSKSESDEDRRCCRCCFLPAEPPRGEVVMALPARVNVEYDEDEEETEEAESAEAADRIDLLEQDLTRLTVVVEELVEQQAGHQRDITRIATLLEELIRAESADRED